MSNLLEFVIISKEQHKRKVYILNWPIVDMRIGLINHESVRGFEELLMKASKSLEKIPTSEMPNLLVGPDYGCALTIDRVNSPSERQKVLREVKGLSKEYPGVRLLLGSMAWKDGNYMRHSSPMYSNGKLINEFYKKRSNGEMDLAKRNGLTFMDGDCNKNRFLFGGMNICYEICGDHGTQDVTGCDVELISAYDLNHGFYLHIGNDSWDHFGLVCDGLSGTTMGQKFTVGKGLVDLPKTKFGGIDIYDLKK